MASTSNPLCVCHGQPSYWQKDRRLTNGGYWQCPVRRKAHSAARYLAASERKLAQQRDRYDTDPFYRISKSLHDGARRRRATLERRRASLGALPL